MSTPASLSTAIRYIADYDPHALPVARAHEILERVVRPVEAIERVAVRSALDRILAEDVVSPVDVPAHDNSAMDGYALRFADLRSDGGSKLEVVGIAYAGRPFRGSVLAGQAVRIMTGAVLPEGCDTVVMQEDAQVEGTTLFVPSGQRPGQHCRRRGEDLRCGQPVLEAGERIGPADLGLLASLGFAEVSVWRKLRVAFFSTGDELRSIGESLGEGDLYDSNRYTLYGMLRRLGVEPIDLGVVRDDPASLERAVRAASECADAIVSSGGVSVGEADFTRQIMARLGDIAFWSLAIRPGRPLAFGTVGKAYYFGLPGNPIAVMTTFYVVVRAALLRMMGAKARTLPYVRARSLASIRKRPGRTEYLRARFEWLPDGTMAVWPTGNQGSGVHSSMARADCIVVLHHERGPVAEGEFVDCIGFEGLV